MAKAERCPPPPRLQNRMSRFPRVRLSVTLPVRYLLQPQEFLSGFISFSQVGGQAVLGRQNILPTPWLTERHGYDPTSPRLQNRMARFPRVRLSVTLPVRYLLQPQEFLSGFISFSRFLFRVFTAHHLVTYPYDRFISTLDSVNYFELFTFELPVK